MTRLSTLTTAVILFVTPTCHHAFTQLTTTNPAWMTNRPAITVPTQHRSNLKSRVCSSRRRGIPCLHASASAASKSSSSSTTNRWTRWITGTSHPQRPAWARDWMPTWLVRLRPSLQLLTVAVLYMFHMTVLAQHALPFPVQLIPNERGHFQSIGLDSLAGMATLGAYHYFRRTMPSSNAETGNSTTLLVDTTEEATTRNDTTTTNATTTTTILPKLFSTPRLRDAPWKNIYRSKYSRVTSFLSLMALLQAYLWTGRFSLWWEDTFYYLANFYPISVAMHRSLCVLFGHLTWILLGGAVLRLVPRPQSFFDDTWYTQRYGHDKNKDSDTNGGAPQWVWWTIGGYFVSSWLFNIADFTNQWILPIPILEQAQESVVSQLINPEMSDWWASLVGYIAPCITAPWWEEVLYRGFLLPALVLQFRYRWAVVWSGILFSAHHLSATAFIPLTVLGWTWSILYTKSGNLLTTILIHAMWNSRIFLGSWLGL